MAVFGVSVVVLDFLHRSHQVLKAREVRDIEAIERPCELERLTYQLVELDLGVVRLEESRLLPPVVVGHRSTTSAALDETAYPSGRPRSVEWPVGTSDLVDFGCHVTPRQHFSASILSHTDSKGARIQ